MFIRKKKLKEIEQRLGYLSERITNVTHDVELSLSSDKQRTGWDLSASSQTVKVKSVLISLLDHLNLKVLRKDAKPEGTLIRKKTASKK